MVRKATNTGTDRGATTTDDVASGEKAQPTRRKRRKASTEGGAKTQKADQGTPRPSFADSQRKLPDPPPAAEPQRPNPEVAAAAAESTFEANMRAAGHVAGQAYGAVRDTLLKGADAVGELATEDGVNKVTAAAKDVAGRNKGGLVAGAALLVGGLPAVAVALGAAARTAKLTLVDGEDPVAAGKQVYGEINALVDQAPERAAALAGQAAELADQAKQTLTGWAARFGIKPTAKTDE